MKFFLYALMLGGAITLGTWSAAYEGDGDLERPAQQLVDRAPEIFNLVEELTDEDFVLDEKLKRQLRCLTRKINRYCDGRLNPSDDPKVQKAVENMTRPMQRVKRYIDPDHQMDIEQLRATRNGTVSELIAFLRKEIGARRNYFGPDAEDAGVFDEPEGAGEAPVGVRVRRPDAAGLAERRRADAEIGRQLLDQVRRRWEMADLENGLPQVPQEFAGVPDNNNNNPN